MTTSRNADDGAVWSVHTGQLRDEHCSPPQPPPLLTRMEGG